MAGGFDPTEAARWCSREVKRFLTDFDTSLEYQCDADPWVKCHPNWVASEDDLTENGIALRRYLLANPEIVEG